MTVDTTKPATKKVLKHAEAVRARCLSYPETVEDFPWDHSAFKVRGKVFVFLVPDHLGLHVSVKLPTSRWRALELPFAKETGYGLGKSGWISASWGPNDDPPMDLIVQWIDESFRAVAPKRVAALVPPPGKSANGASGNARAAKPAKKSAQEAPGTKTAKKPAKNTAKRAAKKTAKKAAKKPAKNTAEKAAKKR
jgi:predicted DNA-binding protein (MmcQ/YjbR family)